MSKFIIQIANRVIKINTIHTRTKSLCRDFIVDYGTPDFEVLIEQTDIDEQKALLISKLKKDVDLWDGLVEVSVVLKKICESLIDYNTFMFHGATISVGGEGYVFSGNSGVGKSTHIRHWLRNCPDTIIVNGDKPFIKMDKKPKVCGSPWAGKEIQYTNTVVPIRAIIFMERNECNSMSKITFTEAFPLLLQQTYHIEDEEKMRKVLRLLKSMEGQVDFYRFRCNNYKEDCFDTVYRALMVKHNGSC